MSLVRKIWYQQLWRTSSENSAPNAIEQFWSIHPRRLISLLVSTVYPTRESQVSSHKYDNVPWSILPPSWVVWRWWLDFMLGKRNWILGRKKGLSELRNWNSYQGLSSHKYKCSLCYSACVATTLFPFRWVLLVSKRCLPLRVQLQFKVYDLTPLVINHMICSMLGLELFRIRSAGLGLVYWSDSPISRPSNANYHILILRFLGPTTSLKLTWDLRPH